MAREITGMRDYLAQLNERFPDKELLTDKDIVEFLGVSRNTVDRSFPGMIKNKKYTTKVELARFMARTW